MKARRCHFMSFPQTRRVRVKANRTVPAGKEGPGEDKGWGGTLWEGGLGTGSPRAWAAATLQVGDMGGDKTAPRPSARAASRLWVHHVSLARNIAGTPTYMGKEGAPSEHERLSQQDDAGPKPARRRWTRRTFAGAGGSCGVGTHHQGRAPGRATSRVQGATRRQASHPTRLPQRPDWGALSARQESINRALGALHVESRSHPPPGLLLQEARGLRARPGGSQATKGANPVLAHVWGYRGRDFRLLLKCQLTRNCLDFVQNALVIFNQYGSKLESNAVTRGGLPG